jgi:hypothetical protein
MYPIAWALAFDEPLDEAAELTVLLIYAGPDGVWC